MESEGSSSEIQCLNPELLSAQLIDSKNIGDGEYEAIFPKGGPKQRTWLDIKSNNETEVSLVGSFKVSNVIEIGVLDISRTPDTEIKKESGISVSVSIGG